MTRILCTLIAIAVATIAAGTASAQELLLPNNIVRAQALANTRTVELEIQSAGGAATHQTPTRASDWSTTTPEAISFSQVACGDGTIRARACNVTPACGAWGPLRTARFRACPVLIPGPPVLVAPAQ